MLVALKCEPVLAGEHQHAPSRRVAEHEVPIVHSLWEATRVTCAWLGGEASRTHAVFCPLPGLSPPRTSPGLQVPCVPVRCADKAAPLPVWTVHCTRHSRVLPAQLHPLPSAPLRRPSSALRGSSPCLEARLWPVTLDTFRLIAGSHPARRLPSEGLDEDCLPDTAWHPVSWL